MILKFLAYADEFSHDQEYPFVEVDITDDDLTEVIYTLHDFLEAAGFDFPEGFRLGYVQEDDT